MTCFEIDPKIDATPAQKLRPKEAGASSAVINANETVLNTIGGGRKA